MKTFFYHAEPHPADLAKGIDSIISILEHAGVSVLTKQDHVPAVTERQQESSSALDRVDMLIVEGSVPDPEVGYLLAYAIAQKRPLLYLTKKGKSRYTPLATFERKNTLPPNIIMAFYDETTIEKTLLSFLGKLDALTGIEYPTIKFTLRITPSIERYLTWKAKDTKQSKADYVRAMLQQTIPTDDAYQKTRGKGIAKRSKE